MTSIKCPSCGQTDNIISLEDAMYKRPAIHKRFSRQLSLNSFGISLLEFLVSAAHRGMTFSFIVILVSLVFLLSVYSNVLVNLADRFPLPVWVAPVFLMLVIVIFSFYVAGKINRFLYPKIVRVKVDKIFGAKPRLQTEVFVCQSENLFFNIVTGQYTKSIDAKKILRRPRKKGPE